MFRTEDFKLCAWELLSEVNKGPGIRCVMVKKTIGREYTLFDLSDPNLDWKLVASGDWRVVMCISLREAEMLQELLTSKVKP